MEESGDSSPFGVTGTSCGATQGPSVLDGKMPASYGCLQILVRRCLWRGFKISQGLFMMVLISWVLYCKDT